jgi:hypothetical protein
MTDFDFATTYRGVVVPPWIMQGSDDDADASSVRDAFKAGVDAADAALDSALNVTVPLDSGQAAESLIVVKEGDDEPARTRRYVDVDGDVWTCSESAWGRAFWGYSRLGEEPVRQAHDDGGGLGQGAWHIVTDYYGGSFPWIEVR